MFRKNRAAPTPARAAHPNPVMESRLRQLDLLRERIHCLVLQEARYHAEIGRLYKKIRGSSRSNRHWTQAIDTAREQLNELGSEITRLANEVDEKQYAAEVAEAAILKGITAYDSVPQD